MIQFFEWLKQGYNSVIFIGIVAFLGWVVVKAARGK